ncbi:MAG: BamA/TamA family outer membrane protein [Planctomycetes bacterium]|nr:BamA/TamA family outer membrane protein [Planctomycetota bacterium]
MVAALVAGAGAGRAALAQTPAEPPPRAAERVAEEVSPAGESAASKPEGGARATSAPASGAPAVPPPARPSAPPPVPPDWDPEGKVVRRIDFRYHNPRAPRSWDDSKFFNTIRTKPGMPYSWRRTTDDLQELYKLGLYQSYQCAASPAPDDPTGCVVQWVVVENPYVREIKFDGDLVLKEDDITALIPNRLNYYATPSLVDEAVRKIRKHYREKGYLFAVVENPRLRPAALMPDQDNGDVILTFKIEAGPPAKYDRLRFIVEGIPAASDDDFDVDDWVEEAPEGSEERARREELAEVARFAGEFFAQPSLTAKVFSWLWRKTAGGSPYETRFNDFGARTDLGTRWYNQQTWDETKIRQDLADAAAKLRLNGWLDARVLLYDVAFAPSSPWFASPQQYGLVTLTIKIVPGRRYRLRRVNVTGAFDLVKPEEVREMISVKDGEPYVPAVIFGNPRDPDERGDVGAIKDRFGNAAYRRARIGDDSAWEANHTVVTTRRDESDPVGTPTGEVDLNLAITQGDRVKMGDVNIRGNSRTKDSVIRRWMTLRPDDDYNEKEFQNSKSRVISSRYFDLETTRVYTRPNEQDPFREDIYADVKEANTGQFSVGGSFSSADSFAALFNLNIRNFDILDPPRTDSISHFFGDIVSSEAFRGAGQVFNLRLQPGVRASSYQVDWSDPTFLDRNYTMDVSAGATTRDFRSYSQAAKNYSLGFGKYWNAGLLDGFSTSLTYTYSTVKIHHVDFDAPEIVRREKGITRTSAVTLGAGYDQRDNTFDPTEGYYLQSDLTLFGGPMGADVDLLQLQPRASGYYPLWTPGVRRSLVLTTIAQAGWNNPFRNRVITVVERDADGRVRRVQRLETAPTPIFQRFFVGDFGSLRGFQFHGIGPRENGEAVGGDFFVTSTVELSFPLVLDILKLVTFFDMGQLQRQGGDFDRNDFRNAVGFGFRFYIPPLGPVPLALDIAWPQKKGLEDGTQRIHFNLGFLF